MKGKFYRDNIKPLFDWLASLLLVILCSPLFFLISILLLINNGKILYAQIRSGKDGKPFKLLKFCTMTDERDETGKLLPDVIRTTRVGEYLRKTSLDELPQLFNVLTGQMSLIGPRPLPMEYIPLYSDTQRKRLEVKPGITGWAQVNGRNTIDWDKKFMYDIWYIENQSFFLDLLILWLTFKKVIMMEGINQSATETMQPFTGNQKDA